MANKQTKLVDSSRNGNLAAQEKREAAAVNQNPTETTETAGPSVLGRFGF